MAGQIQDQLEAQRALTRMVSHEVRSPLTRLKLVLDLMERPDAKALLRQQCDPIAGYLDKQMLTCLGSRPTVRRTQRSLVSAFELDSEWSEQAEEKGIHIHGRWITRFGCRR